MKPALVLIPGMMCDARLLGPQLTALAGAADIWVADITRSADMASIGRDVLADCPFERFCVAGLSMGGIVAMELLRQVPDRIAGLALLDTNHRAETPERRAARAPQIARAKAGRLREVLIEEMKPNYLAPPNRTNAALLDLVLAMGLDLGPDVFERQSLALRDRPDSAAALAAYGGPALVLCGRHDALCPPERHREIAALLAAADLAILEDAGHLTTLESPAAVNAHLSAWLQRIST